MSTDFSRSKESTFARPGKPLPSALGAKCHLCPFAKNGVADGPVWGIGQASAQGLVVAESPGPEERARGIPLVGSTGQEFDRSLLTVGLKRANLYLCNAIACQPKGPKSEINMKQATNCCRPFLRKQLEIFRKRRKLPVFVMGTWAYFSVYGDKLRGGILGGRGFIRKWSFNLMDMAVNNFEEQLAAEERKRAKEILQTQRRADRSSKGGGQSRGSP